MRTAAASLALFEPRSLAEALRLLRDAAPLAPLAGGTDVYVALNAGRPGPTRFLDLSRLRSLRGIRARRDGVRLGALTTFSDVRCSALCKRRLPMLVAAAAEIGGVQIQNRGTLGGNLANASPAGDSLPVLLALEAAVVLRSLDGVRRVPVTEFFTGYRQTVRRQDELIVAIEVPRCPGKQWFRKVGTRAAQAIAKVVVAGVRTPQGTRLALGSVAPTPIRAWRTEQALAAGASLAEAQRVLATEISPIDDHRSTAAYRTRVAQNLLAQLWSETR